MKAGMIYCLYNKSWAGLMIIMEFCGQWSRKRGKNGGDEGEIRDEKEMMKKIKR